jgi:hypothetical protein
VTRPLSAILRWLIGVANLLGAAGFIALAYVGVMVTASSGMVGLALPPNAGTSLAVGMTGCAVVALLFSVAGVLAFRGRFQRRWQLAPLAAAAILLALRVLFG